MAESIDMNVEPRSRGGRCVYCHDGLRGQVIRCSSCGCLLHAECRAELTRCPTIGCSGLRTPSANVTAASVTAAGVTAAPAPARIEPIPMAERPWRRWALVCAGHAAVLAVFALYAVQSYSSARPRGHDMFYLLCFFLSPILAYLGAWTFGGPLVLASAATLRRQPPRRYRARNRREVIEREESTSYRLFLDLVDERGVVRFSFGTAHYWHPSWIGSVSDGVELDVYARRWEGPIIVVHPDGRSLLVPGVLVTRS